MSHAIWILVIVLWQPMDKRPHVEAHWTASHASCMKMLNTFAAGENEINGNNPPSMPKDYWSASCEHRFDGDTDKA